MASKYCCCHENLYCGLIWPPVFYCYEKPSPTRDGGNLDSWMGLKTALLGQNSN
jgi:hypothetical protein